MKSTFTKIALSSALLLSSSLFAADIDVKIVNLTKNISFTPLLVTAHSADAQLYAAGQPASASMQMMAEGGNIAGLVTDLTTAGANNVENPAGGLLAPGASTTASLTTDDSNDRLSIVAMMLPTNDGFIGLNNYKIPTTPGVYKVELDAHDAGTEANDEIVNGGGMPNTPGIPAHPGAEEGFATNATGIAGVAEGYVHIHRGNIGDFDKTGGMSDLDATTDRFINPVAAVIITVK